MGILSYYIFKKRRKFAFNNLAQAHTLNFSNAEIKKTARRSFASSGQIFFESLALYNRKKSALLNYFTLTAPSYVINNEGPKICFICHKGNWEGVFLYSSAMNICHAAVARALANPSLQSWITEKRSRFGSQMITKTNGIKEMIRVLKSGLSLGLVADQAYPDSPYSSSLFGVKAYSVQTPALLARKLKIPIFFNDAYFSEGKWNIKIYDAITSNPSLDKDTDLKQMMDQIIKLQEDTISQNPHEWMWYHQRWKQGGYYHLPKKLRLDQILVILPDNDTLFDRSYSLLKKIRKTYPRSFITALSPKRFTLKLRIPNLCVASYTSSKELFIDSYLYQGVFNFSHVHKLNKYYFKRGAHITFDWSSVVNFPFI